LLHLEHNFPQVSNGRIVGVSDRSDFIGGHLRPDGEVTSTDRVYFHQEFHSTLLQSFGELALLLFEVALLLG
jgi:hypothetical protein